VFARFATLKLTSAFQPVVSAGHPRRTVGHEAFLRATFGDGTAIASATVFEIPESDRAVIYLDRLCRIVHMLNYLRQSDVSGTGALFLNISARHVWSVPDQHGWYFEGILRKCGLAPERIVLDVPVAAIRGDRAERGIRAIANYRARGYRVAVEGVRLDDEGIKAVQRTRPDLVKIDCRELAKAEDYGAEWQSLCRLHEEGRVLAVTGVETLRQSLTAYNLGADGQQGRYFGAAAESLAASARTVTETTVQAKAATADRSPLLTSFQPPLTLQFCW
jgi:EAL domain-containing protein (putative c-di-GMP-specific phosphodiesterase class I)